MSECYQIIQMKTALQFFTDMDDYRRRETEIRRHQIDCKNCEEWADRLWGKPWGKKPCSICQETKDILLSYGYSDTGLLPFRICYDCFSKKHKQGKSGMYNLRRQYKSLSEANFRLRQTPER